MFQFLFMSYTLKTVWNEIPPTDGLYYSILCYILYRVVHGLVLVGGSDGDWEVFVVGRLTLGLVGWLVGWLV